MNEIRIDPYLHVRTVKCIFFHTKKQQSIFTLLPICGTVYHDLYKPVYSLGTIHSSLKWPDC